MITIPDVCVCQEHSHVEGAEAVVGYCRIWMTVKLWIGDFSSFNFGQSSDALPG